MLKKLLGTMFGTRHERERKRVQPIVDEINEHYARLQAIPESELVGQTAKFRAQIEERTASLREQIATLREAKRSIPNSAVPTAPAGSKKAIATRSPKRSTICFPKRSLRSAKPRAVWLAARYPSQGRTSAGTWCTTMCS